MALHVRSLFLHPPCVIGQWQRISNGGVLLVVVVRAAVVRAVAVAG